MNKLRLKRVNFNKSSDNSPKFISLISGKGGVGKSILSFNLADSLAAMNKNVLLVDADINFGNLHILANAKAEYGLKEFYAKELSLKEAVTKIEKNLDVLASAKTSPEFNIDKAEQIADLMNRLRIEGSHYDYIIFDHSSGFSKLATIIAYASDINLIVLVPELTSISDSYGLFKYLMDADAVIDCRLLINRVESPEEASHIFSKFCAISERFIEKIPALSGFVGESELFRKSIAAQLPLSKLNGSLIPLKEIKGILDNIKNINTLHNNKIEKSKSEIINNTAQLADIKE